MINYLYILAITIVWIKNRPKLQILNRKPFNCELCMAFWLTFAYEYTHTHQYGNAFIIALLAPLTLNIYNKLWVLTLK